MEGTSGVLWGRLASVRRTLAWAALAAEEGRPTRYVGANCARLLGEVLSADGISGEIAAEIARARVSLEAADALPEPARSVALAEAGLVLEAAVPLASVGAGLALGEALEPRASLILPGGEDLPKEPTPVQRAPVPERREARGAAPRSGDGQPRSAEPSRAAPDRRAEERRPSARPEAPAPVPAELPEARPPDPVEARLPLGHLDGTGAALTSLDASPALVAALDNAGVGTVAELLLTAPVGFDRPPMLALEDPAVVGASGFVRGRIATRALRFAPGLRCLEIGLVTANSRRVLCRWSGPVPRRAARWQVGAEVAVVGTLRAVERGFLIDEGEPVGADGRGSGWLPLYGLDGVDDRELRDLVGLALGTIQGSLRDPLPDEILVSHRLLPLDEALRDAHFPANAAGRGRARMAFEELLLLQLALSRRIGRGPAERGLVSKALHTTLGQLAVQFDLALNDEQEFAFSQIRRDLMRPGPMARVLEGDVGTAKGLVALLTAVIVVENRAQVAFVSSDPTTAERQYLFAEGMLRAVGIKAIYGGDALNHAAADAVRRGEVSVVFGTPALVTQEMEWRRLGLVVVMEQAEFGTLMPNQLDHKGPRPDLLVVAAGPLPPSLLLSAYGPFEVSALHRTEPLHVAARTFPSSERAAAYACVSEWVAAGRQAIVAFPIRGGQDALGREDAERVAKALGADQLPGVRIGVYCSDMSREERGRIFDDFRHRRLQVLIATTAIEDGPPVPSCTVVVVEHADRFDLTRLHRIRGHVGHGRISGHCLFVLSEAPTPEGLRAVERASADPLRLELLDDDLDAPGGPRVSPALRGLEPPPLAWAEMPRDREMLLQTRALAFQILKEDAALRRYPAFRRLVSERWPELLSEPERGALPAVSDAARGRKRRRRRRRR